MYQLVSRIETAFQIKEAVTIVLMHKPESFDNNCRFVVGDIICRLLGSLVESRLTRSHVVKPWVSLYAITPLFRNLIVDKLGARYYTQRYNNENVLGAYLESSAQSRKLVCSVKSYNTLQQIRILPF